MEIVVIIAASKQTKEKGFKMLGKEIVKRQDLM